MAVTIPHVPPHGAWDPSCLGRPFLDDGQNLIDGLIRSVRLTPLEGLQEERGNCRRCQCRVVPAGFGVLSFRPRPPFARRHDHHRCMPSMENCCPALESVRQQHGSWAVHLVVRLPHGHGAATVSYRYQQ